MEINSADQNSFNDYLYELVKKYGYDSNVEYIKFYEHQIDVLANSFIPFEKVVASPNAKNAISQEVTYIFYSSLFHLMNPL